MEDRPSRLTHTGSFDYRIGAQKRIVIATDSVGVEMVSSSSKMTDDDLKAVAACLNKRGDRSVPKRGPTRKVENNSRLRNTASLRVGLRCPKACEIVPAPTLAVERELPVVGQSGALELCQGWLDRLATGDARQGLPERKHVEQRIVEATAGHGARYVSGVADECHTSRDEPRWQFAKGIASEGGMRDREELPVAQALFAIYGSASVVGFAKQRIEYAGTKCRGDSAAM
jgi:hypothetical protein